MRKRSTIAKALKLQPDTERGRCCEFPAAPHLNHRKRAQEIVEEQAARVKKRKARCMCLSVKHLLF
jgi:hypothetical protein